LGGQFCAGNELDAGGARRHRRTVASLDRVMVRESNRSQLMQPRLSDQFLWRICAVGKLSVQMQIGELHFTCLAGRINSLFTLSRMPFTNLPLSWVENFLAISTASLMLTTGGISSRCSIS